MKIAAILVLAVLFLYSQTARADESLDWTLCIGGSSIDDEQSIQGCTRLIDSGKLSIDDLVVAYNNRGLAFNNLRKYDRAIIDLNEAIRLQPNYSNAYLNRGYSYAMKYDYDRALADFDRAIELSPNDDLAYSNRGNLYSAIGKEDLAIKDYSKALSLNLDNPKYLNNRAVSYANIGKYQLSLKDFRRAIELVPGYAKAYSNRGRAYLKMGEYDLAIADLEKALSLNRNLGYWTERALIQAREAKAALQSRAVAAKTGARVALVIGNSNYANDAPLPNSRRDAVAVAKQLEALGYKIFSSPQKDYSRVELEAVIDGFGKAVIGAEAAIVWYTGHGQKMREVDAEYSEDWVIPVDAKIADRADIAKAAVRVERLKNSVLAAETLRLVVIDACRDSKFYTGGMGSSGMGDRTGLKGALVVYSTQPGNTADAGPDDGSSPFAQAFLELLPKMAKDDVRKFFSAVAERTMQLNPDQRPEPIDGLADGQTVTLAK